MTPAHFFAPRLLTGFSLAALLTGAGFFASSRPAHTAGGPIPVTIANTVQTQNVDDPDQQPFQVTLSPYSNTISFSFDSFTVPAGKRAVIEYYSAELSGYIPPGGLGSEFLSTTVNGSTASYMVVPSQSSTNPINQITRIYADPGTEIVASASQFLGTGSAAQVIISGYYVDAK